MGIQIRNDFELYKIFTPKLKEAVDYVVNKIWNENKELVEKMVYDAYEPTVYNRTGEFKEAWNTETTSSIFSGRVEGKFYYDWSKLTPGDDDPNSPRYGQHVSAIDRFLMTEYLAEVIYEGLAGPAFGHGVQEGAWAKKRDVWEELNKVVGKRKLKQWFQEGCDKVGLPVVAHKTALGVF